MPRGGYRGKGGRPKGSVNKITSVRQMMIAKAMENGVSPLDVMIFCMREAWDESHAAFELAILEADEEKRKEILNEGKRLRHRAFEYATHAAPYIHPKLASSQVDLKNNGVKDAADYSDAELLTIAGLGREGTDTEEEGTKELN